MARSFLATLRGSDARSLARALALLLIFGGLVDALHSGTMAGAMRQATVLCAASGGSAGDAGRPSSPLPQEHGSCFVPVCRPQLAATVIADDSYAIFVPAGGAKAPLPAPPVRTARRTGNTGARGPPVLA